MIPRGTMQSFNDSVDGSVAISENDKRAGQSGGNLNRLNRRENCTPVRSALVVYWCVMAYKGSGLV
jgi:hypothetical protein